MGKYCGPRRTSERQARRIPQLGKCNTHAAGVRLHLEARKALPAFECKIIRELSPLARSRPLFTQLSLIMQGRLCAGSGNGTEATQAAKVAFMAEIKGHLSIVTHAATCALLKPRPGLKCKILTAAPLRRQHERALTGRMNRPRRIELCSFCYGTLGMGSRCRKSGSIRPHTLGIPRLAGPRIPSARSAEGTPPSSPERQSFLVALTTHSVI